MMEFENRITGITSASIEKRFNSLDPWKMLSEYIWNGLDADAKNVDVVINRASLGGVESIEVHDDGDGIDFTSLNSNFDNFDDSSKNSINQKGNQGRGRFSFHKYATKASWYTKNQGKDALIQIDSTDLTQYKFTNLVNGQQTGPLECKPKGTSLYLENIPSEASQKIPSDPDLISALAREFSWKLIVSKDVNIRLNGTKLVPPRHELRESETTIGDDVATIRAIRWLKKPQSEKSNNYFLDQNGQQKHVALTGFNYKNEFFYSVYICSKWFENFTANDDLNGDMFEQNSNSLSSFEFKGLLRHLKKIGTDVYHEFLRRRAERLVEEFEDKGFFPSYSHELREDRLFRISHVKDLVKNICIADPTTFNGLKPKQTKIIIALLDKLTVSDENDSLLSVLQSVMELNNNQLDEFASQIKQSKLDHIISTIGLLQRRVQVIEKMKYLFKEHPTEILETPDLQGVIERNTWLFGPLYETIGAEEDDFTKTAKLLWSEDREIAREGKLEENDLIEGAALEGAKGQVDLFLARRMVTIDHSTHQQFYKCTIIEIKRPSIALNKKHLAQVERYAEVLHKHPAFHDEQMRFDVILVGTKISKDDYQINKGLRDNAKAAPGLVSGAEDRIKVYVKTWATIFNDFDITYSNLLEKLKVNRAHLDSESKAELIEDLQQN